MKTSSPSSASIMQGITNNSCSSSAALGKNRSLSHSSLDTNSSTFDVTKLQCSKMTGALDEATKNDANFVPSKLLDFLVGVTADNGTLPLMGCTRRETCDWLVMSLAARVETGQYWVALKVYSIVHQALMRGSLAFIQSIQKHGMRMFQYSHVIDLIRTTTQENVSGAPLPCTIGKTDGASAPCMAAVKEKHPQSADTKKRCSMMFSCKRRTERGNSVSLLSPTTDALGSGLCNGSICPGSSPAQQNGGGRDSGSNSSGDAALFLGAPKLVAEVRDESNPCNNNLGVVDLYQEQQDFFLCFLSYLESLCQYRRRHPSADLIRGRIDAAPEEKGPAQMADLKTSLEDTLELLKSIAAGNPRVPVGSILAMTIVRKRMNDARVLYRIAAQTLLKMLVLLFGQAKLCVAAWRDRPAAGDMPSAVVEDKDDAAAAGKSVSRSGDGASLTSEAETDDAATPPPRSGLPSPGDSDETLRQWMAELFARWYHAMFQFDRTVLMMQGYCEELEKNSGETYLVAAHLHRIPPKALRAIRDLLKMIKERYGCQPCHAITEGECDGPGEETASMSNMCIAGIAALDFSAAMDCMEAHLRQVREIWGLQITSLQQLFEMEGEAPQALQDLHTELESFINAKKEFISSQIRQQSSSLVQGLSESTFPGNSQGTASPLSVTTPKEIGAGSVKVVAATPDVAEAADRGSTTAPSHHHHHHQSSSTQANQQQRQQKQGGPSPVTSNDSLSTGAYIIRRRADKHGDTVSGGTLSNSALPEITAAGPHDVEVIPLTEEMQRTDESIQELLQADEVVVVCNEPFSCNDHMKLADRFQIISGLEPLGEGSYGRVYRAWDELVGCYLAAKELPLDQAKKRSSAVREVLKEYMVLTDLNHRNILRVIAFMVVGKMGRIFMEWMPSGSLQDVLRFSPRGALRENVVSRYTYDALQGLRYLHSRGVLHRDVKPGNMLLSTNGTVKLTDFGTSSVLAAGKHTLESPSIAGTVPYMAPEAVQGLYSKSSDIWSLGCAVLELVSGKVPWADPETGTRMDAVPLLFKIGSLSDTDGATAKERPNSHFVSESSVAAGAVVEPYQVRVSDHLDDFLRSIFVVDRKRRPTAEELLEHPFIRTHQAVWEERHQAMMQARRAA